MAFDSPIIRADLALSIPVMRTRCLHGPDLTNDEDHYVARVPSTRFNRYGYGDNKRTVQGVPCYECVECGNQYVSNPVADAVSTLYKRGLLKDGVDFNSLYGY